MLSILAISIVLAGNLDDLVGNATLSKMMYEKQKIKHATFGRIKTNVPGFISKPVSNRTFPGTFVLVLRKVAGAFFGKMLLQIVVHSVEKHEKQNIKHATFGRIKKNVPGFISKQIVPGFISKCKFEGCALQIVL